jgi:protein SCO1/2
MARSRKQAARGSSRFLFLALAGVGLVLLVAGGILGLALHAGPRGMLRRALASAIGGPFDLVDQDGHKVTAAVLDGKWHLVYFGYTNCPDSCPTALNDMAVALGRLGPLGRTVGIVFITVDPARDTPAVMKSYVANFDAPILALTGTPAEIAQAAHDYHVFYAKSAEAGGTYAMDHSSIIYAVDPKGRFAASLDGASSPDDIAARLRKLLS